MSLSSDGAVFSANFGAAVTTAPNRRPAPSDDFWYMNIDQPSSTGELVNSDTAPRISAVMACVRVLAESLASLPLYVYKIQRLNQRIAYHLDPDNSLFDVLAFQPNQWQTAYEFWEMAIGHVALRGNFYAQIVAGERGPVTELIPLHPDRMTVNQLENTRLEYQYYDDSGREYKFNHDEIFRITGFSSDGLTGLNPIELARNSIGLAMAAESYGAEFFANGAEPGGVLEHPGQMGEMAIRNFRKEWNLKHSGKNRRFRIAIIEEGMKYHEIGVKNNDAQFLETRNYQKRDIAAIFRVPPHMIGDLDRASYNNVEHMSLGFLMYTMMPWFRRVELATRRDLIVNQRKHVARFNIFDMLRGDIATRYKAYALGKQWGWLSTNDIREFEMMNPIPDGDVYLEPLNMKPSGKGGRPSDEKLTAILWRVMGDYRREVKRNRSLFGNAISGERNGIHGPSTNGET